MDPKEISADSLDLSEQSVSYRLTESCFGDSYSAPNYINYSGTTVTTPPRHADMSCRHRSDVGPCRFPKRRGRPIANNAARERSRVKTLRSAFLDLQRTLPAVPPDTKLSKLDVLVLATAYIAHLMSTLHDDGDVTQAFAANGCMHPVKKWPMRTRLYAGILSSTGEQMNVEPGASCQHNRAVYVPWAQGI